MTEKFLILNYPVCAILLEQSQETKTKCKGHSLFQIHCVPGKVFILPPDNENFLPWQPPGSSQGLMSWCSRDPGGVPPPFRAVEVVEEGGNRQCWHHRSEFCLLGLQFAHLGNRGINNYQRTGTSWEHEIRFIWKTQRQTSTSPKQPFHTWTKKRQLASEKTINLIPSWGGGICFSI